MLCVRSVDGPVHTWAGSTALLLRRACYVGSLWISQRGMTPSPPHRSHGLDTLRALAIFLVMAFHGRSFLPSLLDPICRFGWMGVDLFFVLSGYLIAAQLVRDHARTGCIRWRNFYSRRAFRVLPAYLAVLLVYVARPGWREAPGMAPLWQYLTFTYNLFVNYPAQRAFSHVWSLCVEEQFYLVLPILLSTLLRRPSRRRGILCAVILLVVGVGSRSWVYFHTLRPLGPDADTFGISYIEDIYYPTWSRMDGLLAGVLLAVTQTFLPRTWERLRRHGNGLMAVGVALIALCCSMFRNRFDSVGPVAAAGTLVGFPLLAAGLAALLLSSLGNGPIGRWRVPGVRAVATLAYSTYLTHKLVLHACERWLPERWNEGTWPGAVGFVVGSFAVAALLYFAVERPFLKLRDRVHSQAAAG